MELCGLGIEKSIFNSPDPYKGMWTGPVSSSPGSPHPIGGPKASGTTEFGIQPLGSTPLGVLLDEVEPVELDLVEAELDLVDDLAGAELDFEVVSCTIFVVTAGFFPKYGRERPIPETTVPVAMTAIASLRKRLLVTTILLLIEFLISSSRPLSDIFSKHSNGSS